MCLEELKEILQAALETYEEEGIKRVTDFRAAGILGWNEGLVVRTEDGSEFQITIVKSK